MVFQNNLFSTKQHSIFILLPTRAFDRWRVSKMHSHHRFKPLGLLVIFLSLLRLVLIFSYFLCSSLAIAARFQFVCNSRSVVSFQHYGLLTVASMSTSFLVGYRCLIIVVSLFRFLFSFLELSLIFIWGNHRRIRFLFVSPNHFHFFLIASLQSLSCIV